MRFRGLRRLFRRGDRRNESSTLKYPEEWLVQALLHGMASEAGIKVTPLKVMGLATVFACVNVVAETLATLPLKLMRAGPDGSREPARGHPLYDVVSHEPNGEMTSTDFRLAMQGALSLRKNAYAQIRRNRRGEVMELVPVHPAEMAPRRVDGRIVYQYQPFDGGGRVYEAREVLHVRGIGWNGLMGMDPVGTLSDVFGLACALEMNAAKFFANDSKPGLTLEHPGMMGDQAYKRLKEGLEARSGPENAYKTLILEEGMKVARARMDNTDAQFDETRERQDYAIARVFRVPPHKVGLLEKATFSNIEQQNIEWATDTIAPQAVIWEQQLDRMLLTRAERAEGLFFKFNLAGLLRGDLQSRYEAYARGRNWGWLSVNDIRELEEMNPVEGGDQYLNPLNMVPQGYVPSGAVPMNGGNGEWSGILNGEVNGRTAGVPGGRVF